MAVLARNLLLSRYTLDEVVVSYWLRVCSEIMWCFPLAFHAAMLWFGVRSWK